MLNCRQLWANRYCDNIYNIICVNNIFCVFFLLLLVLSKMYFAPRDCTINIWTRIIIKSSTALGQSLLQWYWWLIVMWLYFLHFFIVAGNTFSNILCSPVLPQSLYLIWLLCNRRAVWSIEYCESIYNNMHANNNFCIFFLQHTCLVYFLHVIWR